MKGRVLIVDDAAEDRFLLARELARELPDLALEEITDADQLTRALALPDVVACVTDYQIRWTDGLAVLRAFKAQHPDAPVVMFTGSGDEDVAVEAMKSGLDDYVVKSQKGYGRAARALHRALDQAAQRRAQRAAEERLEKVFRGVPVGLLVLAPDGRVVEANPAAARALGLRDRAEVVGADLPAFFEDEAARAAWRAKIAAGEPIDRLDARLRRPDGASILACITATPAKRPGGAPLRYDGVLEDVTRLRRDEALLRDQAERLAENDRRKDEFLATLAHELRNPLAAILSAAHLMTLSRDPARRERDLRTIERQARRLGRMVDDLLDVARLTRGTLTLQLDAVDLAEIAGHVAETARPLVEHRKHELTLAVPPDPVWVEGDPVRLEQIASNLVENAAKYTEPGGKILLRVEVEGDDAILRVRDNGVGMPKELVPRIFDLFVQADRELDRAQGGLGIGLAVVRRLVEMHHGTIQARSEGRGQGSEFVVRLPRREAPAPRPEPAEAPPAVTPRRVLVVEDNEDVGELLVEALELSGHEARLAKDGPAALALEKTLRPDVILLDIGLPGMSGYEVARRLRAEGCRARLVALSGYGQEKDREQSREAGFDLHLTKPITPEMLERVLAGAGDP